MSRGSLSREQGSLPRGRSLSSGVSVQGCLCPEGSLSSWVSDQQGLCPGSRGSSKGGGF